MKVSLLYKISYIWFCLNLAQVTSIAQSNLAVEKENPHFDISIIAGFEGFQYRRSMNDALSQNNYIHLSNSIPLTLGMELNVTNNRKVFKASMWFSGLDSMEGNAKSAIRKRTALITYGYDLIPKSDVYLFPFAGLAWSVTSLDLRSKENQMLVTKKYDLLLQSGIGIKFRTQPEEPRKSFIPTFGLYAGVFVPIISSSWKIPNPAAAFIAGKMNSRFHRFLTITAGFSL